MSSFFAKPRSLAEAVDKVARHTAGKDWGLYANLLAHWTEIVGADYAKVTTPVKITFPFQPGEAQRKNGVLTVRLPKGLAMEFSFKSEIIRMRINSFFGYDAFARIALDPAAIKPPKVKPRRILTNVEQETIAQTVTKVESDALRNALKSFGEALYTDPLRR